jgi:hypothetical protein
MSVTFYDEKLKYLLCLLKALPHTIPILYYYDQFDSHASRGYLSMVQHAGSCRIYQAVRHAKNHCPLTKKLNFSQNFVEFVDFFFGCHAEKIGCRIVESENQVTRHTPCRSDCNSTVWLDLQEAKDTERTTAVVSHSL